LRKIIFILLILILTKATFAQFDKVDNLPKYDFQIIHFGMSLAVNTMDFTIHNSSTFFMLDSVYSVENIPRFGFNINIVSNLNIHKYFSIRFLPGLNFGERDMDYVVFSHQDSTFDRTLMKIESTFLDFPLLIKYKSKRLNNFRPYLIGGGSIKFDLAAQKRIDVAEGPMIRLRRTNYNYEVGFGTDFFLQYFKFALELKYVVGINNVLVPDYTQYTKAIERMNSKMIVLSFLFEGSDIQSLTFWKKNK